MNVLALTYFMLYLKITSASLCGLVLGWLYTLALAHMRMMSPCIKQNAQGKKTVSTLVPMSDTSQGFLALAHAQAAADVLLSQAGADDSTWQLHVENGTLHDLQRGCS